MEKEKRSPMNKHKEYCTSDCEHYYKSNGLCPEPCPRSPMNNLKEATKIIKELKYYKGLPEKKGMLIVLYNKERANIEGVNAQHRMFNIAIDLCTIPYVKLQQENKELEEKLMQQQYDIDNLSEATSMRDHFERELQAIKDRGSVGEIVNIFLEYKQSRSTKEYGIMTFITFEQFSVVAKKILAYIIQGVPYGKE